MKFAKINQFPCQVTPKSWKGIATFPTLNLISIWRYARAIEGEKRLLSMWAGKWQHNKHQFHNHFSNILGAASSQGSSQVILAGLQKKDSWKKLNHELDNYFTYHDSGSLSAFQKVSQFSIQIGKVKDSGPSPGFGLKVGGHDSIGITVIGGGSEHTGQTGHIGTTSINAQLCKNVHNLLILNYSLQILKGQDGASAWCAIISRKTSTPIFTIFQ